MKFDLAQGYHQVRIRETFWWKTSFRSQLRQFEWKVMPLGLQGPGSSSVLCGSLIPPCCGGSTQAMPPCRPTAGPPSAGSPAPAFPCIGLSRSRWTTYSLQPDSRATHWHPGRARSLSYPSSGKALRKSFKVRVRTLGAELSRSPGLRRRRVRAGAVDPRKVSAVRDWPVPTSNADLRRFMGLCIYYRRFLDGYADVAAPLTRLCGPHWA